MLRKCFVFKNCTGIKHCNSLAILKEIFSDAKFMSKEAGLADMLVKIKCQKMLT